MKQNTQYATFSWTYTLPCQTSHTKAQSSDTHTHTHTHTHTKDTHGNRNTHYELLHIHIRLHIKTPQVYTKKGARIEKNTHYLSILGLIYKSTKTTRKTAAHIENITHDI